MWRFMSSNSPFLQSWISRNNLGTFCVFQGSQMKTVVPRIVVSNICRFCGESGDPSLTRKPKGKEGHGIERGGHFQSTHPSKLIWVTMFLCSFFLMSTIVRQNPADWPRLAGHLVIERILGFWPASYFSSGAPFFLRFSYPVLICPCASGQARPRTKTE